MAKGLNCLTIIVLYRSGGLTLISTYVIAVCKKTIYYKRAVLKRFLGGIQSHIAISDSGHGSLPSFSVPNGVLTHYQLINGPASKNLVCTVLLSIELDSRIRLTLISYHTPLRSHSLPDLLSARPEVFFLWSCSYSVYEFLKNHISAANYQDRLLLYQD